MDQQAAAALRGAVPPVGSFRYEAGLQWEQLQQLVMQHECPRELDEVERKASACLRQHNSDLKALDRCLIDPVATLHHCAIRSAKKVSERSQLCPGLKMVAQCIMEDEQGKAAPDCYNIKEAAFQCVVPRNVYGDVSQLDSVLRVQQLFTRIVQRSSQLQRAGQGGNI
eukprot:TRINITY_DN12750_c0_g1_i1.p1 TRINITY_DN12750_c0_g1~~TRINITY_DN12750_c0_g1_i1.p1  ORF type:complete len:168 (+),score=61.18 TRINITY_DN12750_c0_g1_i1:186-689(+)